MNKIDLWEELGRCLPFISATRERIEKHLERMSDAEFRSFIEWVLDDRDDDDDDYSDDDDDWTERN